MCRPTTEKNASKTPHFFAAYKTGRENWFLKEYKRWVETFLKYFMTV